jgi:hypothetical protein
MRRFRSKWSKALAGAFVLSLVAVGRDAAACCTAPSTTGAFRLATHEKGLVGVEARGQAGYGTFTRGGSFAPAPAGTHDLVLEQRLFATLRAFRRGQLTLTLPMVETMRGAPGASSAGGGIGDVRLGGRWDFTYAGGKGWPGIAALAGGSAPTGRAPEQASDALGAGATGTGMFEGWGGLAIEQERGDWLFGGSAIVALRTARDVGGSRFSPGPRATGSLFVSHSWQSGIAAALVGSFSFEGNVVVDGVSASGTSRRITLLTAVLQLPVGDDARFVGSAFFHPPIGALGASEPASGGISLSIVRPWS